MKSHIEALLTMMETESDKLDLLTCIALGTDDEDLFNLTEEMRHDLVYGESNGQELLY